LPPGAEGEWTPLFTTSFFAMSRTENYRTRPMFRGVIQEKEMRMAQFRF